MIEQSKELKVIKLKDFETGFRRLDRIHHNRIKKWLSLFLVLKGDFTDYHLHLPVNKNKTYLRIVFMILKFKRISKGLV